MRTGSSTSRPVRCTRSCLTKAPTCARSPRCIGCCATTTARSVSGAARPPTRRGSNPSPSRTDRTNAGRGTSPNCMGRPSGPIYCLFSIIDIYSRYTVGWMLATRESKQLAALQQRQPVLGVAFQDAEVPARLPRPVRLPRGRQGVLRDLLPLVQPRPSPFPDRHAHPVRRPPRPRRRRPPSPSHVLTAAYAATPERFVNKQPEPFPLPGTAWINRPDEQLQPTQ